jgi:hypothetical protein
MCEVNWVQLAQDRVHWPALLNTVMNICFTKGGGFLDQLFKNNSAPWSWPCHSLGLDTLWPSGCAVRMWVTHLRLVKAVLDISSDLAPRLHTLQFDISLTHQCQSPRRYILSAFEAAVWNNRRRSKRRLNVGVREIINFVACFVMDFWAKEHTSAGFRQVQTFLCL